MSGSARLGYVPDLMDRSRLDGLGVELLRRVEQLLDRAAPGDLVVVDLSRAGAVEVAAQLAERGCRVVAFAPHVERGLFDLPGVEVVPRSRFFSSPSDLLGPPPP